MNKFLSICLFLCLFFNAGAQNKPLSNRIANYNIDVTLFAEKKILLGKETLVWKNTSTDNITELQFHLYLNAFRDKNSTFMKESGGQLRGDKLDATDKANLGYIDVVSMQVRNGETLTQKLKFIQPDDLNDKDRTVISVPLSKPLKPNETITLDIDFRAKLPKIFARTGFADNYFLVGQWFPKIGVYEPAGMRYATKGQWNCHQFHAHTEFYADFGSYLVNMTIPKDYKLAATGIFQKETLNKNNTKTISYKADDVHDFAWTASPRFEISERQWKHVKIKAVMQPEHSGSTERYFQSAITALNYFEKHVGRYPHTVLSLIDPPANASGSGGMEYPTFITCGTLWGLPKGLKFPELVTIHEFGHQYFQGMLASNEFEESFLDEGFNQYFEGRIMDENYSPGSQVNLFGFTINDMETSRRSYVKMKNPKITEVFRKAWEYPQGTYTIMTYTKTAVWMKTLENLIGRKVMDEVMQTYFARWRFRHPCVRDFISIVNEIVHKRLGNIFGPDMNWYFEQVLYKAPVLDYAISSLNNTTNGQTTEGTFTAERLGDMILPTEILVKFMDGSQQLLSWSGKEKTKVFKFKKPVASAKVDPLNKLLLDLNFNNNSKATEPSTLALKKYSIKIMFWVQNLMQWAAMLS
ncbi:M1 family metallopeptidase [Emticicia sp. 21SJ11W-3]|uniref:M1 family metallopeptidase n=1 Tax=Emticicia sp. 21SJ11W-3 TaxID=2916755 RepID=UPI00209DE559|nr:M1 family metallopeptidase [Emticicia sp. 21SJ11W-3]UTA67220.1 M1 family metallopeptidase [Emticicia sp. 21SJ11W-3]